MNTLPPAAKLRVFLLACAAWLGAAAWLVGCVVVAAPLRVGFGAALAVVLLGLAIGFIKHDMEMDLIRRQAPRATELPDTDVWEARS